MNSKMTPCERLGYKVGDEFEVISHHAFKKGQVVTLHEDDGTECPLFAGDGGGAGVFDGVECSFATLNKQVRKIANKLKPAKQALADAIHRNGGWPERALWAVQDNCIAFFLGGKPEYESGDRCWYSNSIDGACVGAITCDEKVTNWHQTILSREEYYQAYPKADDDGWIEWNGGIKGPVEYGVPVDVKTKDGNEYYEQLLGDACWHDNFGDSNIIAYRLHRSDVKPEFCESVMRSIPEPEEKPTIEKLAQDYRNKLDLSNRKQQEADDAKAAADAALGELERAGEAHGLLVSPITAKQEPELVIAVQVGDEVECVESNIKRDKYNGMVGRLHFIDESDTSTPYLVNFGGKERIWCHEVKFIRRQ